MKSMCRYVVYLSSELRFVTIDNYVSGVISLNHYYGYDVSAIRQDFAFKTTLAGVRRVLGDPTPERPTLSVGNLMDMFQCIVLSNNNHIVMWTCIVVAFRALLRKCNLVPNTVSESSSDSSHFLRRGAVTFHEWGMLICISSSKTIQHGQRQHKIPVTFSKGSPLCAATLLKRHMDAHSDLPVDAPVFMVDKSTGRGPLLYPALLKFLKFLLKAVKIGAQRSGMHSMHRAGAAYMHSLGLSLEANERRETGQVWQCCYTWLNLCQTV